MIPAVSLDIYLVKNKMLSHSKGPNVKLNFKKKFNIPLPPYQNCCPMKACLVCEFMSKKENGHESYFSSQ